LFYNHKVLFDYPKEEPKMTKRNIVHVEIPASDGKAAGAFYEKLFGWHIVHDDQFNYTMFDAHEGPGGGFSPINEHTSPGDVLVYVNSEDIEADLKAAVELGASIAMEKTEIPGTGWFGVFVDPTGNPIGLYTNMAPAA
jgi:predicted enzyme related to lactoylglutathione lyase